MIGEWWRDGVASAGLFIGAAAWFASTQLNYALAAVNCTAGHDWLPAGIAFLLTAVSIAGGLLSWRAWTKAAPAPAPDSDIPRPNRLLAGIGVLGAALFALVIATQGAAALILQACAR
jgi:hypothetical protein